MAPDINEYSRDKSKSKEEPLNDDSNHIDIECPHCNHSNVITFSKKIECKNCNKYILGAKKTYKTSKTNLILTALASVTIGAVVGDKYISADEIIILLGTGAGTMIYMSRLAIETEYKIMKTCIDTFGSNTKVRDSCFCVVRKLNNYLNPQIAKLKGEDWLLEQLDEQYNKCKEPELLSS